MYIILPFTSLQCLKLLLNISKSTIHSRVYIEFEVKGRNRRVRNVQLCSEMKTGKKIDWNSKFASWSVFEKPTFNSIKQLKPRKVFFLPCENILCHFPFLFKHRARPRERICWNSRVVSSLFIFMVKYPWDMWNKLFSPSRFLDMCFFFLHTYTMVRAEYVVYLASDLVNLFFTFSAAVLCK